MVWWRGEEFESNNVKDKMDRGKFGVSRISWEFIIIVYREDVKCLN